ncbi:MmgE/PrpD family protein [Thermodesulfobacteriota bacterium]
MNQPSPAPITRLAAEFVVANRNAVFPADVIEVVRTGVTDTIASMLAAINEPVTKIVCRTVRDQGGRAEIPYLLGEEKTTIDQAALINATAAHALDLDDYAFACHPSAVLVPVLLACGPYRGAAGKDLAAAYVAGYEIWADLMLREPDHLHSVGWHPTPLFGCIGAAAAASSLMGLDKTQAQHAIGLAASHAGGMMGNFGSMAKPYHAGKAAQAGVFSARLALKGMTATEDVLEGQKGLLQTLSPNGRVDVTTPQEYHTFERIQTFALNIKKYPTVGSSQRAIESVLSHLANERVDMNSIEKIEPLVSEKHASIMIFHRASKPEEAKFCLEFAMACALLHGRVGLRELTLEAVCEPALQALMEKVHIRTTKEYDPNYPVAAPADYVTITFKNGEQITTPPIKRARGHADIPLSREELLEKFVDCADFGGISKRKAHELFDLVQRVDTWTSKDVDLLRL